MCRGFAKVDNPNVKMESPNHHVEASELHRIQVLDLFQHCNKQIGDKGFYIIKESDILLETPPKKSYIPDIVTHRQGDNQSCSSKIVSKVRSPRRNNSDQISENEVNITEDMTKLENNIDKNLKLNGDIDSKNDPMDVDENLSENGNQSTFGTESLNGCCRTPDSPPDVSLNKSEEDEEFEDIDEDSDKESNCSSASSYSGHADPSNKRRKSNKKGGPALKTKQMKKIKGRKSTKYFKFEEKKLECKPGDKVAVEIAYTYSTACVLWQNGEVENDIPSPELFPIHHLDELEFFPGDFVMDSNKESVHDYGVVVCCDHQARTCMVKWMKTVDISKGEKPDESVEPEEVSVYDIKDHPDFKFRPGQTVIRVGEPENVTDDTPAVGQVQKLDPQGVIYVKWPGLPEPSRCYPQELYIVGEEMSEFDSSSDSSEWSTQEEEELSDEEWETESEEDMDDDKSDDEDDENSDSEAKAKPSEVDKLFSLGKSKTEELDALLERAKTALQKLEELFHLSQDFSRENCYRDILTIYRKCRDLEKILKSNYLEDSDIVDLIEEVKREQRKEKTKKINKHLLEVFESRKNQGQKSKMGDTACKESVTDSSTNGLVNGDISQSDSNSAGKMCSDSEIPKTESDSRFNKDLCLRVYQKLHVRLIKMQQVMERNNLEKSCSHPQTGGEVSEKAEKTVLHSNTDTTCMEINNKSCILETERSQEMVPQNKNCDSFEGGKEDNRKDTMNSVAMIAESAAVSTTGPDDPFFHLLEEVLSNHTVKSEDTKNKTSIVINKTKNEEEKIKDNNDEKKDSESVHKSSDVSKLMLMGKSKKAELDGFLQRTQTALQKLEQIFKIFDANLQSSFYENCYEDIINIYQKCHDIEKILKSSYLEESEIVDLIEDVKRELGKEKKKKGKRHSLESRKSQEQKADLTGIGNNLEKVHLSGRKVTADEGIDSELCEGDNSNDQAAANLCSDVKSTSRQSSVDKELCLSICKQLNLCMNKIQQEMNKRWQKAEKSRLNDGNNTSTNTVDKMDENSVQQSSSSERSSEPVGLQDIPNTETLTGSCKAETEGMGDSSESKGGDLKLDEDKISQTDFDGTGDGLNLELDFKEADSINPSCRGFHLLEEVPLNHRFLTENQTLDRKTFMNAVMKEMKLLQTSLPEGIIVKGYEDRMDLYSVMIVGPAKTPYEDGLFFFEVHLPTDYPGNPPNFHYLSYCSDRLNPNLYDDGKVCVSLLGTWGGKGNEMWTQNSNLLQVLISIQGLILVDEPYYNEAGYEKQRGTQQGHENSKMYNEMAILKMIESLTHMLKNPPSVFKDEVKEYSKKKWPSLIRRLEHWIFNSSHLVAVAEQKKQNNTETLSSSKEENDNYANQDKSEQSSEYSNEAQNNQVNVMSLDSNNHLEFGSLDLYHDVPDFPLLPPSKGFCLTLKKHLERLKKALSEDLS
ncbi:hypothetical protein KUTeg_022336 [Tegillarca granosa]|uniref:UBC core domain-containing protein n=1 Tax=Tegillarca granosa TaxID=220873 RepID=A0ABQ9E6A7_TEGGR|nr:hypothetical protein KUTeg_022336 [Tegillarca granosa]